LSCAADRPLQTWSKIAHALGQRAPLQELHREIDRAVRQRREIVDLDDVVVADRRRAPRFLTKARDRLGVRDDLRTEELEREAPVDVDVLSLVHLAHAALTDEAHHAVTIGNDLPDEIGLARVRIVDERRAVTRAECNLGFIARVACGTDLLRDGVCFHGSISIAHGSDLVN